MAFGYSPYPGVYQPQFYPQPNQNQMMQNPQQLPMQNQPMQQMQQVQAATPQQSNGMIWISGKAEADSWPVLPGNAVALWDSNAPVVYLRQADGTGKPSTTVYDLVERTESRPVPVPQIDINNVVTWDKLDEYLTERLKKPSRATKAKEDTEHE